ncbi:O-antigen ligase family protein [Azonexus sp. R2A-61]|uniref:O-antigen ligase family protein n=1 Tax=Azonexus sp. R2A61 TaxID=2744443 RepID=UPI001F183709
MSNQFLHRAYPVLFGAGYCLFFLSLEKAFGMEFAPLVSKLFLLFSALFCVFFNRIDEINLISVFFVLALISISGVLTDYHYFEWSIFFLALNQVVSLFLLFVATPRKNQMVTVVRLVMYSPLLSITAGVFYEMIGVGSIFGIDGAIEVPRLQGSTVPAFLAGISLSGVLSALLLYYYQGKKQNIFWFVFNFCILLLTAARMPIALGCFLVATIFFIIDKSSLAKKLLTLLAGICGLLVFLVFFGKSILDRFGNESSSGRDVLWDYFYGLMSDYPDFGIGFGHSFYSVPPEISVLVGGGTAAHNDYIRLAVEIGFYQTIVFFLVFSFLYLRNIFSGSKDGWLVGFAFLVSYLIFVYVENALATPTYYPMLLVGWYGSLLIFGNKKAGSNEQRSTC